MSETKPGFVSIDELEDKIYSVLAREYDRYAADRDPWVSETQLLWLLGYDGTSHEVDVALKFLIRKCLIEKVQVNPTTHPASASLYKILTPHEIAQRKFQQNE